MYDNQRQVIMFLPLILVFYFLTPPVHGGNLAIGQPSVQSSTWSTSVASYGNDDSLITMTHTNSDRPGWWCVGLQTIYDFVGIYIYNRLNKLKNRLSGFEIRVSDFDECSAAGFLKARVCHKDTSGSYENYTVNGCSTRGSFSGRYVYLNTGMNTYLHVREVKVYGTEKYSANVALNQPAVQSSTRQNQVASRANDGQMSTMTHTNRDNPGWWCVQLPTIYRFIKITIYNRAGATRARLTGLQIRLSEFKLCNAANFKSARVCHTDTTGAQDEYEINGCNQGGDFDGRFVYLNTATANYLNFKELQAFGKVKYPDNVALRQPAVLSSTFRRLVASIGNDGELTKHAQSKEDNPGWWCVKLPTIYNLIKIIIHNRDDSYNTRLSGFQIRLSNLKSCSAAHFKSAIVCHKDSTGAHNVYRVDGCNQGGDFAGRYIYLNTAAANYLNFNELQVFGKDSNLLPNVATHRFTRQSSTSGGASELSIDGDRDTCSRTDTDRQAWLCVDLDNMYQLDNIQIIQPVIGAVSGYEVRIDRVNYCSPRGFNEATLCYRDTVGATVINGCNQGSDMKFDARAIYISVPNKSLSVCEFKAYPLIGPTCDFV